MTQFDWSPERVETLKTLWAQGKTCSQIASAFNHAISRNAVIGKVHRMGLDRRQPGTRGDLPKTASDRAQRRPDSNRIVSMVKLRKALPPVEPVLTGNEPTLTALTRSMCRWPVGDETGSAQMFCGAPTEGVYCPYHRAKAYSAAPAPRERVSRVMGGGGRVMR